MAAGSYASLWEGIENSLYVHIYIYVDEDVYIYTPILMYLGTEGRPLY